MPDYLAVKDWKDELKKHKVDKDGGLLEALTAWSKVKGKDPEDQVDALEAVTAKAEAAEKLLKGNKDLAKFAATVAAKASEELKKVEAAAEAGDEDQAKDKVLYTGLKRAKTARMFFAVAAKGTSDGRLILSKVKVKPTDIAAAKSELGGARVFRGMCFGEDGKHIFELRKEPPATLDKLLKKIAKQQAGLMIRAICRVAQVGEDLGDDPSDEVDGAPDPEGATGAAVPYAELRASWDGARKQAAAELKRLQSAILEDYKGDNRLPKVQSTVALMAASLDRFKGELEGALHSAASAGDAATRNQQQALARQFVKEYLNHVRTDPWLVKVDRNPFLPLNVQGALLAALEDLDQRLNSGS